MKLNNKGFAFSTLLYGLLAVITLLLAIIFASYKNSYDETFYYSALTEETLNKCIDQEMALENCYRSGSSYCNKSAYYSCLGYDDTTYASSKESFKDKLMTLISDNSSNFKEVSGANLKYMFQGTNVNNYVTFSGMLWRVVGITATGEIKLVLSPTSAKYLWDNSSSVEWSNSSLKNYLNNDFLGSLSNTEVITNYQWPVGKIDESNVTTASKSNILSLENATKYQAKVGLLSPSDVAFASGNSCTASSKIFNDTTCATSWISETWFLNSSTSSQKSAYYLNKTESKMNYERFSSNTKHLILPSIYLSNSVQSVVNLGNGTVISPYVIEV